MNVGQLKNLRRYPRSDLNKTNRFECVFFYGLVFHKWVFVGLMLLLMYVDANHEFSVSPSPFPGLLKKLGNGQESLKLSKEIPKLDDNVTLVSPRMTPQVIEVQHQLLKHA